MTSLGHSEQAGQRPNCLFPIHSRCQKTFPRMMDREDMYGTNGRDAFRDTAITQYRNSVGGQAFAICVISGLFTGIL